jgi:hypothetical protein
MQFLHFLMTPSSVYSCFIFFPISLPIATYFQISTTSHSLFCLSLFVVMDISWSQLTKNLRACLQVVFVRIFAKRAFFSAAPQVFYVSLKPFVFTWFFFNPCHFVCSLFLKASKPRFPFFCFLLLPSLVVPQSFNLQPFLPLYPSPISLSSPSKIPISTQLSPILPSEILFIET